MLKYQLVSGYEQIFVIVLVTLNGQTGRKTFALCDFVSLILALVQRRSNTISVVARYTETNKQKKCIPN